MLSCSHWGMFDVGDYDPLFASLWFPDTTYQRLNFGPELT
jgi:hypothetical protein